MPKFEVTTVESFINIDRRTVDAEDAEEARHRAHAEYRESSVTMGDLESIGLRTDSVVQKT